MTSKYYPINVLIIWYKGEVVEVFGIKNFEDSVIITLPKEVFDQIAKDKETLEFLPAKAQANFKMNKKQCNISNAPANRVCGTFGNLKIEIVKRSLLIK